MPCSTAQVPAEGSIEGLDGFPTRRAYELKRLRPRHRRVLDLYRRGLPLRQIARTVGMSESAVDYTVHSAVFAEELERLDREAEAATIACEGASRARIEELSGLSVQELEHILCSRETPARVRVQVAFAILDLAGVDREPRHQRGSEDYLAALRAAYEIRKAAGTSPRVGRYGMQDRR